MRTVCFVAALLLTITSAQVAHARDIRPHFDKPWRERVADAQAAYWANPGAARPIPMSAPAQKVFSPNERWEVDGLILAWECENSASNPDSWDWLWMDIIDAAWDGATIYVYIIAGGGSDASDVTRCKNMLQQQTGLDPSQVVWFNESDDKSLDSIWLRDYGPFFVVDDSDTVSIVDANYVRYNRTRDDGQPAHFAAWSDTELYSWDFATEGGNFLPNGNGICLVSDTIYGLNPGLTETQIEEQYASYLGCTELVVLPAVDDVTGHVDMWLTWIDATTLVVGEYTEQQDATSRAKIEQALDQQLSGLVDPASGDPIEIVRIPMPNNNGGYTWRTYTNGIWIDDTYLMPVYSGYESLQSQATAAFEAKGVTVVPIDADVIISSAGALHCISKTIPVGDVGPGPGPGPGNIDPVWPGTPAWNHFYMERSPDGSHGDGDGPGSDPGMDAGCALGRAGGQGAGGSGAFLLALGLLGAALAGRRRS